jgi:hypothetical protein
MPNPFDIVKSVNEKEKYLLELTKEFMYYNYIYVKGILW